MAGAPWSGLELGLGYFLDLARVHDAVPDRQHRHLVEARRLSARLGDLLGVPVALPLLLVREDRDLCEVERVVARAEERPEARAVVERGLCGGAPRVLELVAAKRRRVPEDRDDLLVAPQ